MFTNNKINGVFIIMGVSGSGKSTVGQLLAAKTGFPFLDADDFHPVENINKMASGIPLTDDDRKGWLEGLQIKLQQQLQTGPVIIACSALKEKYRQILSGNFEPNCHWIFLKGDYATIYQRLAERPGHFMQPAMLESQFDALEIPAYAIEADINNSGEEIVKLILEKTGIRP